jgi:hypothetical protein
MTTPNVPEPELPAEKIARVTDKDLREWHKTSAGFHTMWPSSTVYALCDELLVLRAAKEWDAREGGWADLIAEADRRVEEECSNLRTQLDRARKEALAEAEDFVRRHGEEELADAIAALASAPASPG